jgi:hypothetical protein
VPSRCLLRRGAVAQGFWPGETLRGGQSGRYRRSLGDIDIAGEAHKKKALPETMEQARELADSLGVDPTLSVDSGHGLQAYWLFSEPWIFTDDDEREQARQLIERFQAALRRNAEAAGWTLDATHDLARVLRLPGTINYKLKGQPTPAKLLDASGPRYSRDALAALVEPTPTTRLKATAGHSTVERARRYAAKLPPAISGEGGHNAAFKVAQVLRRGFGLSLRDSRPIMCEFNERCVPPWSEEELEHKLESADKKSRLPLGYLLDKAIGANEHTRNGDGHQQRTDDHLQQDNDRDPGPHLTDYGNGRRLIAWHGDVLLHCFPWRKWSIWTGSRWEVDATAEATRRAKLTVTRMFKDAAAEVTAIQEEEDEEDK